MSERLKILITGADGFIGKNLKEYLMSKGHGIAEYEFIENVVPIAVNLIRLYIWVLYQAQLNEMLKKF